jgi:MYXO-CTERM domain-containing protein
MISAVSRRHLGVALALLGLCAAGAPAAVVPFTEDFDLDSANWYDADGLNPVSWVASGGPDGGAFASTVVTVPDPLPPTGLIVFRGQDEFNSSGGAFEGDWIADGVSQFSFWLRHDGPAPLDVFGRFASPLNFPGAAGVSFVPVLPDTWTEIVIDIAPTSPQIVLEGPISFDDVFSNIGNVQVGILPSDAFINQTITVDLDKVSITPAPGGLLLLGLGGLAGVRRRRS